MDSIQEIYKIKRKIRETDIVDDCIILYKEAIRIADACNDLQEGFDLRLELIEKEYETTRCIESFPAFTWILETHKANPDLFDPEEFLWEYKWMVGAARRNVNVSMEQFYIILDSYKTALLENGYSLRVYHTLKSQMASFIGDKENEKKYIDIRNTELRDDMTNCEVCELDDEVNYYMSVGEIKKALLVGDKLLKGKAKCTYTPFITYTGNLMYLYNAGEIKKATEFFKKAEKLAAKLINDTSYSVDIGQMIEYLCVVGNRDKAWDYFEKTAEWNIDSADSINCLFSTYILPLFKEGGVKKLNLSPKLSYYNTSGEYNLEELYKYYYTIAEDLSKRFDERNGTSEFTNRLKKLK